MAAGSAAHKSLSVNPLQFGFDHGASNRSLGYQLCSAADGGFPDEERVEQASQRVRENCNALPISSSGGPSMRTRSHQRPNRSEGLCVLPHEHASTRRGGDEALPETAGFELKASSTRLSLVAYSAGREFS